MAKRFALWYPRTHPAGRHAGIAFGFWAFGFYPGKQSPGPETASAFNMPTELLGPSRSSQVGLRIGRSDHRSIGSSGHRVIATRKTTISDHPIPQGGMHRSPDLPTVVLVKKSLLGVALLCSLVPAHESRAQTF